ncbi:hypothetical protein V8C86DRAFT_2439687 [Haematococcus lacustris]
MDTAFNEDSVASLVTKFGAESGQHEQAGMLLWDLSAGDAMADVMVRRTPILAVLTKWIEKSLAQTALPVSEGPAPPQRELEICTGIAANLATHSSLSLLLAQHPSLLGLFRDVLLLVTDVPALCELCRLGSVALRKPGHNAWLSLLSSPAACLQLLWLLDAGLLDCLVEVLDAAAQEQAGGGASCTVALLRLPAGCHAAQANHVTPAAVDAALRLVELVLESMLVVLQSAGPAAAALLGLDLQCCLALLDCPGELPAGAVEMGGWCQPQSGRCRSEGRAAETKVRENAGVGGACANRTRHECDSNIRK